MVHLCFNDKNTSRNEYINFITALPQYPDVDQARHRLEQLAAMVKPVMKAHGFEINSLEEFEWNREFAGRNWNAGETIELVLRRQDGSFAPLQWVLMVFCHELAHIKHMNHIPSLHGKLDRELKQECKDLQARGYFGDGFWSSGQRLKDNAFVAGFGMGQLEGLPEYSCGGAFRKGRARGGGEKRKRRRKGGGGGTSKKPRSGGFKGPSLHTGAQTAPNPKSGPGGRRLRKTLPGQGSRVDSLNFLPKASASSDSYREDPNSTFRKRTQSKSAREMRAEAALRRMEAMKEEAKGKDEHEEGESDTEEEEEEEEDGALVLSDSETEVGLDHSEVFLEGGGSAIRRLKEEDGGERGRSTQATRETEEQRQERSQRYLMHERRERLEQDGEGIVSPRRTTAREEWEAFFSTRNGLSSGGEGVGGPSSESVEAATKVVGKDMGRKGKIFETIEIEDSSDDDERGGGGGGKRNLGGDKVKIQTEKPRPKGEEALWKKEKETKPTKEPNLSNQEVRGRIVRGKDEARKPNETTRSTSDGATGIEGGRKEKRIMKLEWECLICTLLNQPFHQRCQACDTSRGQSVLGR
ncbi:WLM-domain-containing protein [Violaceomyces palustris]|uniref:WLM-domain-containing protein n=1 Tax=Violaceomyces palustris TaxID=1673888 RepID=A0ACD0P5H1_9BASI|nr:WLM-domain-containing protein [Violaceomyces palustris]